MLSDFLAYQRMQQLLKPLALVRLSKRQLTQYRSIQTTVRRENNLTEPLDNQP